MSHSSRATSSHEDNKAGTHASHEYPTLDQSPSSRKGQAEKKKDKDIKEDVRKDKKDKDIKEDVRKDKKDKDIRVNTPEATYKSYSHVTSQVLIVGETLIYPGEPDNTGVRQRPRLTTSNSGAEIMLGLQTDDGKSAEVEIDSLESDELKPEEIPKGRVRKSSIVEKLSKSKESELIAQSIMESAGQRQREFEKLINEHQELVQEISRTPSAENIVQSEAGRDP